MRGITISAVFGLCAALALPSAAFSNEKTADNPNGCKIVERKGGEPSGGSNSITSSVTAGGGHVSGFTSGGNGVTVHSGSGGGSSVATAGTTSDGHGTTMVTSSNGDCTIFVDPGKTKEH
jgi:hypothetical protein